MSSSETSNTSSARYTTTEEERREKRLERDRINARERRKRRKLHLFDLEKNQSRLSIENARLQRENSHLSQELHNLSQELTNLRTLCRILQQSTSGVPKGIESTTPTLSSHVNYLLRGQGNPNTIGLSHPVQTQINSSNISSLPPRNPTSNGDIDNQADVSSIIASLLGSEHRIA